MRPVILAALVGLGCLFTRLGVAAPVGSELGPVDCSNPDVDWISLSIETLREAAWSAKLQQHLGADLAAHQLAVCALGQPHRRAPLANVRIVQAGEHDIGMQVQVNDAVTLKTVSRQVDLRGMPQDAHAMTIALGAAELLRASWAELRLAQSHRSGEVPRSVRHAVLQDEPRSSVSLGVRLAGESFGGGLTQGGVDVNLGVGVAPRWDTGVQFGVREGLGVSTSGGRLYSSAWVASGYARFRLGPDNARANLAVVGRFTGAHLQFRAEPKPDWVARTDGAFAWMAAFGLLGAVSVSEAASLELEADAGTVIKGVRVRDDGQNAVSARGLWCGAGLGVQVRF